MAVVAWRRKSPSGSGRPSKRLDLGGGGVTVTAGVGEMRGLSQW